MSNKTLSRTALTAVFAGLSVSIVQAVPTTVRVLSPTALPQWGADIYVNGEFRGQTEFNGTRIIDLKAGDKLVARRRIRESSHYKGNHNWNANQNWNYRVYITSATVNGNGVVSTHTVNNPGFTQNLQLRRQNTLVGLNWVTSCEWDTTFAEREDMRQRMRDASAYLYNATDGQFFIEQVRLTDRAINWANADATVVTNFSLREFVKPYGGGFLQLKKNTLSYMNMCRRSIPETYIHEFGHYGLALPDEYKDDVAEVICTEKLDTNSAAFGRDKPGASCMMYYHKDARKICSAVGANPHNWDVNDKDCWTRIVENYADPQPFARYAFRTPATRGVVPGTTALPVADWSPIIQTVNSDLPNLVHPIELNTNGIVLGNPSPGSFATPAKRVVYSLEIATGRLLRQGNVWFNSSKPSDNRLKLAGLHVGDRIYVEGFHVATVGQGGVLAGLTPKNYLASLKPMPFQTSAFAPRLDPNWLPMRMGVALTPNGNHVEVTVKSPVPFAGTPTLLFQPTGDRGNRGRTVPTTLRRVDESTYVARLAIGPDARNEGILSLTGRSRDGRSATLTREFSATEPDLTGPSQVADPTGELIVRMARPAVGRRESILVGPSEMPLPELEGWSTLVEPRRISLDGNAFNAPFSVVFQLDSPNEEDATMTERANIEYQIVRWTGERGGWQPVTTVQHPKLDVATCTAREPGHYALVGRLRRGTLPPVLTLHGHNH
jgi:hypothetical protein